MQTNTFLVIIANVADEARDRLKDGVEVENADGFCAYVRFITNPNFIGADTETLRAAFRDDDIALILAADQLTFGATNHPVLCIDPDGAFSPCREPLEQRWIVENTVSIGNLLLEKIVEDQVLDGWFVSENT